MGLDISICTDNNKEVRSADYYNPEHDYFNKHNLSRTFCNLMCRQYLDAVNPELNQIGHITGVDIMPLYQMEEFQDDNDNAFLFSFEAAESDEERRGLQEEAQR